MRWNEAADLVIRGLEGAIAARTVTYDFHRQARGGRGATAVHDASARLLLPSVDAHLTSPHQMELEGEKAKLLKCSEFGQAIIDKM